MNQGSVVVYSKVNAVKLSGFVVDVIFHWWVMTSGKCSIGFDFFGGFQNVSR
jgi:hypothetical protein